MQPTEEKTTIPNAVIFSIEGEVYREGELYGPEYAGSFVVKYPTFAQTLEIPTRTTAAIERFGVRNAAGIPGWAYDLYSAIAYLGVLAVEKPAWFAGVDTLEGTDKAISAVLCAARLAERKLAEGKKKSAGTPSSTGT